HTHGETSEKQERRAEAGEAIGLAQGGRPDRFEHAGDDQHYPRHLEFPPAPSCRRPGTARLVRLPSGRQRLCPTAATSVARQSPGITASDERLVMLGLWSTARMRSSDRAACPGTS